MSESSNFIHAVDVMVVHIHKRNNIIHELFVCGCCRLEWFMLYVYDCKFVTVPWHTGLQKVVVVVVVFKNRTCRLADCSMWSWQSKPSRRILNLLGRCFINTVSLRFSPDPVLRPLVICTVLSFVRNWSIIFTTVPVVDRIGLIWLTVVNWLFSLYV